jgi:hypothetical protein
VRYKLRAASWILLLFSYFARFLLLVSQIFFVPQPVVERKVPYQGPKKACEGASKEVESCPDDANRLRLSRNPVANTSKR